MENNYTVYMHKNKINGKVYIGITKQKPQYRWSNGKGYDNQYFKRAIKKYGFNNFEHLILYENITQKEAEQKEIELINYYKSTEKDFGYNISKGGIVNNGVPCSEEKKKKISKANKGIKNGMYGKHHTEEEKKKISEASKKMWSNEKYKKAMSDRMKGKNNHNYQKKCSKQEIEFLRSLRLGKPAPNRKKVICIETNEIFKSIAEAEKVKNVHNISSCCSGKYKTAGGYHWRYYEE